MARCSPVSAPPRRSGRHSSSGRLARHGCARARKWPVAFTGRGGPRRVARGDVRFVPKAAVSDQVIVGSGQWLHARCGLPISFDLSLSTKRIQHRTCIGSFQRDDNQHQFDALPHSGSPIHFFEELSTEELSLRYRTQSLPDRT